MVSPTQRRAGVQWAREAYQLPERRACRVMGFSRSTVRYQSVRPSREPLRARLKELAAVRVSYGYRRLHIMLRREGWPVNRKLIERLYREEGLTLKRKKPKCRRSAVRRERSTPAASINERWAMDFVHDTLSNGRTVRVLTVLDVYSRECVVKSRVVCKSERKLLDASVRLPWRPPWARGVRGPGNGARSRPQ